jgi:hypothetical protein
MDATQLRSAIRGYSENEFLLTAGGFTSSDQIDTFIKQAEQRIYNTIDLPLFRTNVTGSMTASSQYLSVPPGWLADYSMAIILPSGYEYLIFKEVSFIRQAYPSPTTTGLPRHYAIFDKDTFIVGPTPDSNYNVELHYFSYPPSIVTAGTSWIGDNLDSLLLYGSLLEAATFMKSEPDTIKNLQERYTEALMMAKNLGEVKNRTDAYRNVRIVRPLP